MKRGASAYVLSLNKKKKKNKMAVTTLFNNKTISCTCASTLNAHSCMG